MPQANNCFSVITSVKFFEKYETILLSVTQLTALLAAILKMRLVTSGDDFCIIITSNATNQRQEFLFLITKIWLSERCSFNILTIVYFLLGANG